MSISMTRRQQTTTVFDAVVSQVTITDPTHPLSGRTFPLLQTDDSVTRTFVFIKLPSGEHRRVSRKATSLAESKNASSEPKVPPSPVSVRTLLPLLPVVGRLLGATEESVNENELPTRTARSGLDSETASTALDTTAANPVAGTRSAPTTPIGPVSSHVAAAPQTARRVYAKKRGHRS